MSPVVVIASYLDPELVERVRRVDERIKVLYEPLLLPSPQFPADHRGAPFARSAADEVRWRSLLARADILFDFDRSHGVDLPFVAPRVAWIQATSSGIGEYVRRMGHERSMPNTDFTTAAGVHPQPLTAFCLMVMLAFHKRVLRVLRDQQRKRWERFASTDLRGRTLVIIGLGHVGREVARLGQAFEMRVVGVKRTVAGVRPAGLHLDALLAPEAVPQALAMAVPS
jgi:phosphoglycerate dehydrogenase-like enzyme